MQPLYQPKLQREAAVTSTGLGSHLLCLTEDLATLKQQEGRIVSQSPELLDQVHTDIPQEEGWMFDIKLNYLINLALYWVYIARTGVLSDGEEQEVCAVASNVNLPQAIHEILI